MPNCGIQAKLLSTNQRLGPACDTAARVSQTPTVTAKSAPTLTTAIQRAAIASRRETIQDKIPPTSKIRTSRIMPLPQSDQKCDRQDRNGSHSKPHCIPTHVSGLHQLQTPMSQNGDLRQTPDRYVRQIVRGLPGQPLKRTNEQPVVQPVEAPAGKPELL